jgi:hypothetical protein
VIESYFRHLGKVRELFLFMQVVYSTESPATLRLQVITPCNGGAPKEHLEGQGTVSYPYTFLYDTAHNKLDVAPKHLHING